jgi:hypothetical protein
MAERIGWQGNGAQKAPASFLGWKHEHPFGDIADMESLPCLHQNVSCYLVPKEGGCEAFYRIID